MVPICVSSIICPFIFWICIHYSYTVFIMYYFELMLCMFRMDCSIELGSVIYFDTFLISSAFIFVLTCMTPALPFEGALCTLG